MAGDLDSGSAMFASQLESEARCVTALNAVQGNYQKISKKVRDLELVSEKLWREQFRRYSIE